MTGTNTRVNIGSVVPPKKMPAVEKSSMGKSVDHEESPASRQDPVMAEIKQRIAEIKPKWSPEGTLKEDNPERSNSKSVKFKPPDGASKPQPDSAKGGAKFPPVSGRIRPTTAMNVGLKKKNV